MKVHNKLVRDRIPHIIAGNGGVAQTRQLTSDKEYIEALLLKLIEEAREAQQSPSVEELADVSEVIDALLVALNITPEELRAVQQAKADKNGRFMERTFLVSTEG
jgi:predicted house-cleaning noncanonical NTP pyrophosphatase (MazG superfamily)